MDHLAAVSDRIGGEGAATLFIDRVFRQHGLPVATISDRYALHREVLEVIPPGVGHTINYVHIRSSADRWSEQVRKLRYR